MILEGDEARRTQLGNNNAYGQRANESLLRIWRLLVAFRKRHPSLRRERFFDGARNERGVPDVAWHGCLLGAPGWNDRISRVLAFTLGGLGSDPDPHVILNTDTREL